MKVANRLFQTVRIEYIDVLYAQRDFNDARMVLIETKQEQLAAIVNAYQALGGGWRNVGGQAPLPPDAIEQPGAQPQANQPPTNQPPVNPPPANLLPANPPPANQAPDNLIPVNPLPPTPLPGNQPPANQPPANQTLPAEDLPTPKLSP